MEKSALPQRPALIKKRMVPQHHGDYFHQKFQFRSYFLGCKMPSNLVWAEGKHNRIQKFCSCLFSYTGWWLSPTPLKNDGVSSSVGMIFHSQLFMESHSKFHDSSHHQPVIITIEITIFPWFSYGFPNHQTTNQYRYCHLLPLDFPLNFQSRTINGEATTVTVVDLPMLAICLASDQFQPHFIRINMGLEDRIPLSHVIYHHPLLKLPFGGV